MQKKKNNNNNNKYNQELNNKQMKYKLNEIKQMNEQSLQNVIL